MTHYSHLFSSCLIGFCRPCVKAFDVDIYEHKDGEDDLHLVNSYAEELPGCKKMEVCGHIQQGESITLRIFDNQLRDNADIKVVAHAGDTSKNLEVERVGDTYAYELTITERQIGVQVIEVTFDGEPISQSPIRVMVDPLDCDAIYGEGSNRAADSDGECVCGNNTYQMGNTCMESQFFFLIIFAAVFAVAGIVISMFLGYKKKQSDSVWHINVDELHFNEPPEVIGQGGFGVVVLGEFEMISCEQLVFFFMHSAKYHLSDFSFSSRPIPWHKGCCEESTPTFIEIKEERIIHTIFWVYGQYPNRHRFC
jgi:hypothetical protein